MSRPARKKPEAMNKREGEVLIAVYGMHREYGIEADFTRGAIELVLDSPAAGSLAGLAMLGYLTQREGPDGLVYRITTSGMKAVDLILKGRRPVRVNGHDRTRR